MRALIVRNGYYTSRAYARQIERLREELSAQGIEATVYSNDFPVDPDKSDLFSYDFCIFLDKDVALATLLERKGVRVFNSAQATLVADDKGLTAAILQGVVKQQKTFVRPKRYFYDKPDVAYLRGVESALGYPLVAKASHGSLGEQVALVSSWEELLAADKKLGASDGLYQAYRAASKGRSYRVIVVGGKAIGAMELTNDKDFRSNAHEGGAGKKVDLPDRFTRAAEKAAQEIGLDYCGVDLFCDDDVVIEVNGNAFFETFERETGINAARLIVQYIREQMK